MRTRIAITDGGRRLGDLVGGKHRLCFENYRKVNDELAKQQQHFCELERSQAYRIHVLTIARVRKG